MTATHEQHYEPLKLQAKDKEDLCILSACLQDALVPVAGIHFDEKNQNLTLIANRFCWECCSGQPDLSTYNRVQAALKIDHVTSVKYKGFDPSEPERIICLLTLQENEKGFLDIICAGGCEIRLSLTNLNCQLKDLEEPYPTCYKPTHPLEDEAIA